MAAIKLLDNVSSSTTGEWSTIGTDGTVLLQSPNSMQLTAGDVKVQMRSSESGDIVDYYHVSQYSYSGFGNLELSVKKDMQIRAVFTLTGGQSVSGFTVEAIGDFTVVTEEEPADEPEEPSDDPEEPETPEDNPETPEEDSENPE